MDRFDDRFYEPSTEPIVISEGDIGPWRDELAALQTKFDAIRDWAHRARLVIYDYRRFYGTDHRNQELAQSLDDRSKHVMQDWRDW